MHIFKTKWIILKKTQKDKESIITIFSYDYGKIQIYIDKKKEEKKIDIWYEISLEIVSKEWKNIHKARSIYILSEFCYLDKEFKIINEYLCLISLVLKKIPEKIQIVEIYEILSYINRYEWISTLKIILVELKIIYILWLLDNIWETDDLIQKLVKFIALNNIKKIFLLKEELFFYDIKNLVLNKV